VLCSHQPLAQRGKALRIKEREIRRARCETDAIRTSIASTCPSVPTGLAARRFLTPITKLPGSEDTLNALTLVKPEARWHRAGFKSW
jgi:hypothetical protein